MKITLTTFIILIFVLSSSQAQINIEWSSPTKPDDIQMGWALWLSIGSPSNQQRFFINDKNKIQFMKEGVYNSIVEYEYAFTQAEKNAGSQLGCIYYDINNDNLPEFYVNKVYGTTYPNRYAFKILDLRTKVTLVDFDESGFSYQYSGITDVDKDGILELIVRKEKFPDDGNYQLVVYNLNISAPVCQANEIPPIDDFEVKQNYPNPFNPETKIRIHVPAASEVKLVIYDIQGKEVKKLINNYLNSGNYEFTWDGKNEFGNLVSSGTYFYVTIYNNKIESKKMLMLK